jgi:hypothetical protein
MSRKEQNESTAVTIELSCLATGVGTRSVIRVRPGNETEGCGIRGMEVKASVVCRGRKGTGSVVARAAAITVTVGLLGRKASFVVGVKCGGGDLGWSSSSCHVGCLGNQGKYLAGRYLGDWDGL